MSCVLDMLLFIEDRKDIPLAYLHGAVMNPQ